MAAPRGHHPHHVRSTLSSASAARDVAPWRAILSGCCASLVGIGLARFAYTPLLPAIVGAGWFGASAAAYLGAANLAGYLAGALAARPLAERLSPAAVLRTMMVLAVLAFFACAVPISFAWFFVWRIMSGVSGGALMVLAAPTVLPHVAASRRGVASGAIFAGVGLGIAASGTLVPLLLRQGLVGAWCGLGVLSLVLTLVAWRGWPAPPVPAKRHQADAARHAGRPSAAPGHLRALYAEYGLNATALVPHMIFLVDFVARGLKQGLDVGSQYWVLFGLAAMVGPILSGHLADRAGFRQALRLAYILEGVAVLLPALSTNWASLTISSLVVGAFTPGIVPLVLGRVHELLPHDEHGQRSAWSSATASFALFQATGAYAFSFLLGRTGDYRLLFETGAGALVLALAIDAFMSLAAPSKGRS